MTSYISTNNNFRPVDDSMMHFHTVIKTSLKLATSHLLKFSLIILHVNIYFNSRTVFFVYL